MEYITDEIKERLYSFLISFRAEIILIGISGAILIGSLLVFAFEANRAKAQSTTNNDFIQKIDVIAQKAPQKFIYVDIAGAVEYPDVYKVSEGTRLKALIDKAGGLSKNADTVQIAREMNMSTVLVDQQKIYMPSNGDAFQIASASELQKADSKISLNAATIDQLNNLEGIGEVTAKKIIAGRPYRAISDILAKKIVGKGLYEKIKDSIVL